MKMYSSEVCHSCITVTYIGGFLRMLTDTFWRKTCGIESTFFVRTFLEISKLLKIGKKPKSRWIYPKLSTFVKQWYI